MRTIKRVGFIGGFALFVLAFIAPSSYADVSNQATEMTFNQPVRIPGQVLPAGTYWFTIPDSSTPGSLDVVQIYNADGTKVISTLIARPTDLTGGWGQEVTVNGVRWPTGKLVLTFAEGRNQHPAALLDWYYPGRTDGHEFVYSSRRQRQLDEEEHKTVAINGAGKVLIGSSLAG